jgi:hypothetical protein
MSMIQLVLGTALGFIVARAVLFGSRYGIAWLAQGNVVVRARQLSASLGPKLLSGFVRYAAPVCVSAGLVTLGVWAVSDYLAARSARNSTLAGTFVPPVAAPAEQPPPSPDEVAPKVAADKTPAASAVAPEHIDPYRDPDFKVQRHRHRAGTPVSLKETLVMREEAKARADLLHEIKEHAQRSQYDCEAADHADRYLKAGLDVWGFSAWQEKYFPTAGYQGASLAQCRDLKNVLAPPLDLSSTVAQQSR